MTLEQIRTVLTKNISQKHNCKRFFKTGVGEYGEKDEFLGVKVPCLRKIAKDFRQVDLSIVENLLRSKFNEERQLALLILVEQYQKGSEKSAIVEFYLKNLQHVNNWNLVDSSAHLILGDYLFEKDRSILFELAKSSQLWERRISVVATWYFIRKKDLKTTFEIAKILLEDKHDLIQKAVGWMLRETQKHDLQKLIDFLEIHASKMPSVMLRYATEKFPKEFMLKLRAQAKNGKN